MKANNWKLILLTACLCAILAASSAAIEINKTLIESLNVYKYIIVAISYWAYQSISNCQHDVRPDVCLQAIQASSSAHYITFIHIFHVSRKNSIKIFSKIFVLNLGFVESLGLVLKLT